ncbi:tetratricopeptide repeat protein [Streptomyces chartreusis]|uniref:tetratricopeptide repeat protein n=1 Tax=Streptomyces chartreusis TaxID=1969 RepID=UPI003676C2A9
MSPRAHEEAGRTGEAIELPEWVLADDHSSTLNSRANLAASYWQAGRTGEAIAIKERVLADRERLLGDDTPTL